MADFVLEQLPQRLDQFELHFLRQPADVVMTLDQRRGIAADGHALDHVRIKRALREETITGVRSLVGPVLREHSSVACSKTLTNSLPMILRFARDRSRL